MPIVASITKHAATRHRSERHGAGRAPRRHRRAHTAPRSGVPRLPMDVVFAAGTADVPAAVIPVGEEPDPDDVAAAAALIAQAERPAIIVGQRRLLGRRVGRAWRAAVESLRVPCSFNGLGRGCLPADHELAFTRTRGLLKTDADVVVVIGTAARLPARLRPVRRRAGRPRRRQPSRAAGARRRWPPRPPATSARSSTALAALRRRPRRPRAVDRQAARRGEGCARPARPRCSSADADPIKPTRIYGELRQRLDRDAVVDLRRRRLRRRTPASTSRSSQPGCWLDTGPYGCLGNGLGYAIAARVAGPTARSCVLLGDGAAGFSLMDADTLVRHGLPW